MKKIRIGPVFGGVGVIGAVTLGLGAVFAALFSGGLLPMAALRAVSWGITLVGCFVGGLWVSRKVGMMPLPLALGAVLSYFLIIFVLRGIFFRTVGEDFLIPFLLGIFGAVVGTFVAVGRKKPR